VEETLNRYFGVEKINHDALMGDNPLEVPVYNNGFYGSGGGVGANWLDWCNVSELFDNGDGTFDATVNSYRYSGHYVDESGISRSAREPENIYGHISSWELHDGQRIVDNREAGNDTDIYRVATDNVTLRRYGDSWQIISINGWIIPKTLFADYSWKDAYANLLRSLDPRFFEFKLTDMDGDGIAELLLSKKDFAEITVYTYKERLEEAGVLGGGTHFLAFPSNNAEFPGIFTMQRNTGIWHYEYYTLSGSALVLINNSSISDEWERRKTLSVEEMLTAYDSFNEINEANIQKIIYGQ
jgi:hypothetical protein